MVEEAGLDPDAPPETWDELLVWHQALTKFDDAGNLIQFGLDPYDAEGGLFAAHDGSFQAESWGFEWWDPETKTFNLNNEMMAESFDVLGEFVKIIGPDNLANLRLDTAMGTWGASYNAQVQAMIIEGYWHPGETANLQPEVSEVNRASWVPVPESRRGAKLQLAGGHMVFCFNNAVNPAEVAFPVGEFLNTPEHCDPVFELIGWLPNYTPYLETVDPSVYPGLQFYFDSLSEATELWGITRMETMAFIERKHREVRERHYRGELTGAQAAEEMQVQAELNWEESGFGS
jgi:ABC-type glycerol-3-phosphate transport system substrate-binding protein